ncbi:HD domain-containing protein [Thalassoroseus pseudoceratinae]|uniref:HD domain-containing protein n=1 Tax=Thalassoroseus pseudoceratinae TaxID=2713176 RepID=UPI00142046E1|nr:HD domain-containing protein [Thalassoroseus pseudoceratinae]
MPNVLQDVPELSQSGDDRGLVRIPVEQDVPFTPRVRALVDTPQFQRLRQISQLGLTSLVYPGATHTRFEHALGVFHNAIRYLRQLGKDPRFEAIADRHTIDVLLASALLHDLGHWPFCHPIEDMALPNLPPHEAFAREFLLEPELSTVLRERWEIEPEEVLSVLTHSATSPGLRLADSVLSGPIDIDKMDYLHRDSLHCGVPYGRNFDRNRLMQSLMLDSDGTGLAISEKGRTAAEMMVFARYVMFSEVYWHHTVRAATCQFARIFYELSPRLDLQSFFRMGDAEAIEELKRHASELPKNEMIDELFGSQRVLYKLVHELSIFQHEDLYRLLAGRPFGDLVAVCSQVANEASKQLGCEVRKTDIVIDAPPVHREVQFRVQIHYPKEERARWLADVSPVVASLAREQFDDFVKRVRVFVHPRLRDRLRNWTGFLPCIRVAIESRIAANHS